MAQPKFAIRNKIDRNNFLKYLERNKEAVLHSIRYFNEDDETYNDSILRSDAFVSFWEEISSPLYVRDTDQGKIWDDTTSLLYMLPPKKIETIKVSLRAQRRSNISKRKKQLTVDADVYERLSAFSKREKLTLSDTLSKLLDGFSGGADVHSDLPDVLKSLRVVKKK